MSGSVVLDDNGDREPDYWISDMDPTTGVFIKIAEVLNTDNGGRVLYRTHTSIVYCYSANSTNSICCGFVVQTVVQQIHNKSK